MSRERYDDLATGQNAEEQRRRQNKKLIEGAKEVGGRNSLMSPYHFWRVFRALLGLSHASCRSPYRPLTAREDKSLVRYRAASL